MESSRSHSIFTVHCHATPTDPSSYDYGTMRYGKVSFVDLAGSERQKDTRSEGQTLKEAQNINKSLFTLGKVRCARCRCKCTSSGCPSACSAHPAQVLMLLS